MSFRAKAFFGTSVVAAVVVIPWVHVMQKEQRELLHEGPVKDAARRSKKMTALTEEQQERALEYEQQKKLREELSKDQEVSER